MMDSDSTIRDSFVNQENRRGIKRYFCCFYIKLTDNTLDEKEDINEGMPTWCINEIYKEESNRRSRNSDGRTVRFHSTCN